MRYSTLAPAAAVAVLTIGAAIFAGPLVPPTGPITSTMKTLDQIEARIPLTATSAPGHANAVHQITQPGSYYLTGNVVGVGKSGIFIQCENVTLDLNGYTVSTDVTHDGAAAIWFNESGSITGGKGIVIKNGTVKGGGYASISLNGSIGSRVENIIAINTNGTCISASFGAIVTGCTTYGGFAGIDVLTGSLVENCTVTDPDTRGIAATGATIRNCTVRSDGSPFVGLMLRGDCLAEHNHVAGNGVLSLVAIGIEASSGTQGNRIQNNHIHNIRWGVFLNTGSTNNFVANNTARNCVTHYVTQSSPNAVAPVITAGTLNFSATNPFTNFAW